MKNNLFDVHPAELTAEQSLLSKAMSTFADTMEQKVFGVTSKLNNTQTTQTEHFELEAADYVVKVVRGDVVEKCGFMRTVVKKEMPPMMPEPLVNRYMQIDIYPRTLLVAMLHIATNFSYNKDGGDMVGKEIKDGKVVN